MNVNTIFGLTNTFQKVHCINRNIQKAIKSISCSLCICGHSWNMIKLLSSLAFSVHVWEEKILMGPIYFFYCSLFPL